MTTTEYLYNNYCFGGQAIVENGNVTDVVYGELNYEEITKGR
jgi:hypothetical protein